MTIESLVRRLSVLVIVFFLTLSSTIATVHAAENPRKMTVVSFGLFGDQVIISACYSGVFIPRLADADTLVITAADADHPSFGCEDKAKWTYFGDAFFNAALRRANNLKDAFLMASSLVFRRQLREGFEPSHPQMAGGGKVEPLLVARPSDMPGVVEK